MEVDVSIAPEKTIGMEAVAINADGVVLLASVVDVSLVLTRITRNKFIQL